MDLVELVREEKTVKAMFDNGNYEGIRGRLSDKPNVVVNAYSVLVDVVAKNHDDFRNTFWKEKLDDVAKVWQSGYGEVCLLDYITRLNRLKSIGGDVKKNAEYMVKELGVDGLGAENFGNGIGGNVDDGRILDDVQLVYKLHDEAMSYLNSGDYDVAGRLLSLVLRVDDTNPWVHYHLGQVLLAQGKSDEAIVSYETANKNKPDDTWLRFGLGKAYETVGRDEDAKLQYEKSLVFDPGNETSREALGWLNGKGDSIE